MRVKKKQPLASQRLKESALSKSNFTVSNVYLSVSAAAFGSFTQLMAIFVEQSTFISSSSFHLHLQRQLELRLHLQFQRPVPKLPVNAADQQFRYNIAYRIIMSSASWLLWPQNGDISNSNSNGSNSNSKSNNMQHQQHRRHLFSHLV